MKPVSQSSRCPPERLHVHERLWTLSRRLYQRRWHRLSRVVKALNFYLHHTLLPAEAQVGDGVKLEHYGLGVVIHPNTVIGNNVTIWHGVTIAGSSWIGSGLGVVIEDDVSLGAHAIVMPKSHTVLRIGRGAQIAAGAVVTKDVPAGATYISPTDCRLPNASLQPS